MSSVTQVLLIEDELKIARLVIDYLEASGYQVTHATDGPGGLALAKADRPDLIVLDLGLPGLDGLDVVRQVRARSSVPVIILTARSDESDRIVGLELGADDYVTKPFSPKELVARIRALMRRVDATIGGGETIRTGDLSIDIPKRKVVVGDRAVELTATEFDLLSAMARRPGRIFSRAQLLDMVHGVAFESYERSVDAHIKNLRRKIEDNPGRPTRVLTVYGVGYKYADA